ncbi:MAG: hypothetical protein GY861_02735 [bacterium]|nr:hypothetical protein [bacterium]
MRKQMRKHLFIPDTQITPESPTDHLRWIGNYIVEKMPDVVIQGGDWADMNSLSSYDKGKKKHEGKRYKKDWVAANRGMDILMRPLDDYNAKRKQFKEKQYKPEMHLTLGNHEYRIERAVETNAALEETLTYDKFNFKKHGWIVHDYLEPITIDGVTYSHYFYNQLSGRAYGGHSMEARLKTVGFSFVQGHQQVYMVGTRSLNNGRRIRGLICGACYLHDEDYRGPQGNSEWRGIFLLHEVVDGDYGLMEISLDYLCRRYEGVHLWRFVKKKYPEIFEKSLWMKRQATQVRR